MVLSQYQIRQTIHTDAKPVDRKEASTPHTKEHGNEPLDRHVLPHRGTSTRASHTSPRFSRNNVPRANCVQVCARGTNPPLTYICLANPSILINWTSPCPI